MNIAFFGDIVGRSGREGLIAYIEETKLKEKVDFIIANGENAAHGFGITEKICCQLFSCGVDVITLGNHSFDQKDSISLFEKEKNLVRPLNYPPKTPGHGAVVVSHPLSHRSLLVINLIGRVFIDEFNDDPFSSLEEVLNTYVLGKNVDAIFVDFHAEITAEKMALARHFDGRVSAIIGTHTHVPTADAQILRLGTAFLSDAGMCGDYDSVLGMAEENCIKRFISKIDSRARLVPATKEATVCGALIEIGSHGLSTSISPIRHGGCLRSVGF
jgi:metallophosphoesterase (TIGR00282 family)